jgi:hypothetical protein
MSRETIIEDVKNESKFNQLREKLGDLTEEQVERFKNAKDKMDSTADNYLDFLENLN